MSKKYEGKRTREGAVNLGFCGFLVAAFKNGCVQSIDARVCTDVQSAQPVVDDCKREK